MNPLADYTGVRSARPRYIVAHYWARWQVKDVLNDRRVGPVHDTQHAAQAHADRLNTPRPARPSAQQDALDETKDA